METKSLQVGVGHFTSRKERMWTRFLRYVLMLTLATFLVLAIRIPFTQKAKAAPVIVSQVVTSAAGKGYLQVDGQPYYMGGLQNRGVWEATIDHNGNPLNPALPLSYLENLFEKTAAANFKTIQIPIKWADIETSQGTYNWTYVDQFVSWANQYGLRIDWVWFGVTVGGSSNAFNAVFYYCPAYVNNATYFNPSTDTVWGPGDPIHSADVANLFQYERNAVSAMFDHLAASDTNHRSILFQVWNEADLDPSWYQYHSQWVSYANQLAGAVKSSNYIVATRMNFFYYDSGVLDSTPNVDFAGSDPYTSHVGDVINDLNTSSKIHYLAENGSSNVNDSSLLVTAIVNGGFIDLWQLDDHTYHDPTQTFYTGADSDNMVLGTIPGTSPGGAAMGRLNAAINNAGSLVASAPASSMVSYNVEGDTPSTNYNTYKPLVGNNIGMYTNNGSVGFALNQGGAYYLFSDLNSSTGEVWFNTQVQPTSVTYGYINDNGNWVSQGNVIPYANSDGSYGIRYQTGETLQVILP